MPYLSDHSFRLVQETRKSLQSSHSSSCVLRPVEFLDECNVHHMMRVTSGDGLKPSDTEGLAGMWWQSQSSVLSCQSCFLCEHKLAQSPSYLSWPSSQSQRGYPCPSKESWCVHPQLHWRLADSTSVVGIDGRTQGLVFQYLAWLGLWVNWRRGSSPIFRASLFLVWSWALSHW